MSDILVDLHNHLEHTLRDHPDCISWNGHNLNNSGFFYERARDSLQELTKLYNDKTFTTALRQTIFNAKISSHPHVFVAALFAGCAGVMLDLGNAAAARHLANEAVSQCQFDLFAQNIIIQANHLLDPQSRSLEETNQWLKTRFCTRPFDMIETATSGELYRCCPSYLPVPVGHFADAQRDGLEHLLTAPRAEALKESIMDGSFKYCSRLYCPFIGSRNLMSREDGLKAVAEIPTHPKTVYFSHDFSCNLSCPSCRTKKIVAPKSEQENLDSLSDKILVPLIDHADYVSICGSGDPFASIHFRNLLINYCRNTPEKKRKIALQTNGNLCDARAWESMGLYGHVARVSVSIDAAEEATYDIVRRDGNFARVRENMTFVANLRRTGEINFFGLCFVVQDINYREMPAFAEWGKELGADEVLFTQLRNWGTYSYAEYKTHNIASPDHPQHADLLHVLQSPTLHAPYVNVGDLGNIG